MLFFIIPFIYKGAELKFFVWEGQILLLIYQFRVINMWLAMILTSESFSKRMKNTPYFLSWHTSHSQENNVLKTGSEAKPDLPPVPGFSHFLEPDLTPVLSSTGRSDPVIKKENDIWCIIFPWLEDYFFFFFDRN